MNEAGGNFANKINGGEFFFVWIVTIDFLGKSGNASDSSLFDEEANDNFFGGTEFRNLIFFGHHAKTDDDGFFQLTDAFPSDRKHFPDLFEGFLLAI